MSSPQPIRLGQGWQKGRYVGDRLVHEDGRILIVQELTETHEVFGDAAFMVDDRRYGFWWSYDRLRELCRLVYEGPE